MPGSTRTMKLAVVLTIIGGATSAVTGSVFWVPFIYGGGWAPELGFVSFGMGVLAILGGVLLSRGRIILGANLAVWCGIANCFSGFISTFLALGPVLRGSGETLIALIFSITLPVIFPVLGGILGLMQRKVQSK